MHNLAIAALTLSLGIPGTYQGQLKNFSPLKAQPELSYYLDEQSLARLDSTGFELQSTGSDEIYDLYEDFSQSPQTPMFVSADLSFHTLHLLVDYTVRKIELEELLPKLERLTEGMLKHAERDAASLKSKEAAEAELVYFAVAARLLGNQVKLKDKLRAKVEEELKRIEAHSGIAELTFLPGTREDYSQYVPRGHYTRSDEFRRYFKAMMWYGRLPLHVPKDGEPLLGMKTALLMAANLDNDEELKTLWEEIYTPTAFFFGSAEDLTPGLLLKETSEFFKEAVNVQLLSNDARLYEFAKYLRENVKPKIVSEEQGSMGQAKPEEVPVSCRFMPQRFVPDSYIFSQLVFDRVSTYRSQTAVIPFTWGMTALGPMRVFPRGLDAMAVIGWEKAAEISEKDRDMDYENYAEQFEKMKAWYASLTDEEKQSSIYFRWFELFRLYKEANAPDLVNANLWERKKLLTALGSWTELRHDAILYAKQSYTLLAMNGHEAVTPPPPLRKAVLEEAPELYSKIASCARTVADFTTNDTLKEVYNEFRGILDTFEMLARKQGEGQSFTQDEQEWLWDVWGSLRYLANRIKTVTTEVDTRMALVADVHTDPNSGQVLEEATGSPAKLLVVATIAGKPYVAQGACYTYYEFKEPMSERLTDEAWQEMLDRDEAPDMPVWTEELFVK